MVGIEDRRPPRRGGVSGQPFIAGDDGRFAETRDRTRRFRRTVAVDHQPRIALRDQVGVEVFRQRVGDAGDADIPGDMPLEFAGRQAEIAKRAGNDAAVMVGCQQERRGRFGVVLQDRCNIILNKE